MSGARRPVVLIMAGGTGGHVYPALAVASVLRKTGVDVVWLGTRAGLEARVVPATGIPVEWMRVSGLRGKGVMRALAAPFMLTLACFQALGVLLRVRPDAVLGLGGFVSGPGGVMAWLTRRPLLIHEQNAVAGMTNRWLARLAVCAMEAFPGSLSPRHHPRHTGNPVRREIARLADRSGQIAAAERPLRLLVLGGSLGAKALNEIVPQALARIDSGVRPDVRHQAGQRTLDLARSGYARAGVEAEVEAFVEDMAGAYSWADLVICRAGALTVSELAAAGLPSILVPYPSAVDDHQAVNARYLSDAGAAVLVREDRLYPDTLASLIVEFERTRDRLRQMARRARALARPDAAVLVAAQCLQVLGIEPGVQVGGAL